MMPANATLVQPEKDPVGVEPKHEVRYGIEEGSIAGLTLLKRLLSLLALDDFAYSVGNGVEEVSFFPEEGTLSSRSGLSSV